MEIWIGSLLDGAAQATGAVAIIDVFRAFTTAAVVLANGASQITMVSTVEEALALRKSGLAEICMGEVGGRAPAGFDFGNSPFEVSSVNFAGKSIVQRTSAGTQGIVAARHAERLYATSLVTASATARALLSSASSHISLVAMGNNELSERMKMSCALFIFVTFSKIDAVMHMPCVRLSWQAATLCGFTIRAGHIWIGVIWTLRSTSTVMISLLGRC